MAKTTVRNITISINGKEVENSLSGVGKEIGKTNANLRKLTRGTEEYKAESEKLRNLKKVYKEMNDEIRGQESSLSKLKSQVKGVGPAIVAAFSITAILAFANKVVDIVKEFQALKKETKDLTGLQGTLLDQAVAKTKALSDVYDTDYNENLEKQQTHLPSSLALPMMKPLKLSRKDMKRVPMPVAICLTSFRNMLPS